MMQRQTLESFCASLGAPVPPHIVRIGRRFFWDPHGLFAHATEHGWEAFSAGIFIGEERGGFQPTIALVDLLARHIPARIIVSEKAAWLFLCGRDLLMDGVKDPGDVAIDRPAIVADGFGNVLGAALVKTGHESKKRSRVFAAHLIDRGEYLRRER